MTLVRVLSATGSQSKKRLRNFFLFFLFMGEWIGKFFRRGARTDIMDVARYNEMNLYPIIYILL